ncbi:MULTISPECIES: heat shock protein Hsp18 [Clostridium]|uniref:18 kDa heat shock protein n=2 Tax=Clostridium TaxID=1485 RepID=D8GJW9_CLOLD|nr:MULTISPECIES: heat shock protein Hsp18 [Clostridium]ADK17271.1 18 kDa heat shock protein [Clostridium ljungdahlii DSM 13528]AGY76312.1 Hsp20/alpha crystallin family protein [Clostridium autoethanogenum DSM 10061]ALU36473.1 Heat shock protein Hsp20 [Clostridium autoethanogenum DSM 10061]OAA84138.1 18 kDa heat shock protein [Clostridium ljungdahlii DSM 13528]OVY48956.1 18 kDa heat shock protein [Clostridium autoethanogenum]
MFDMVPFRKNNSLKRGDAFDNFVDSFFNNDFFAPMNMNGFGNGFKVDLKENETSYIVCADLPGINKDSIDLDFNNNYLTISAKRDDSIEDKNENFVRRERRYGEFRRSFYIDNVDDKNITASFNDGVLKVILPKLSQGKRQGKKIDIQ